MRFSKTGKIPETIGGNVFYYAQKLFYNKYLGDFKPERMTKKLIGRTNHGTPMHYHSFLIDNQE